MPAQLPYWVQILQALGPMAVALVVGLAAAALAYGQWKTARDKLRLDLFERRMEVYLLIDEFRVRALKNGAVNHDDIGILHRAEERAKFLFGSDVSEFIEELKRHWLDLINATHGMEQFDEEKSLHIAEKYRVLKDLIAIDGRSSRIFGVYMSFERYRN